jgi:hypothetical protein
MRLIRPRIPHFHDARHCATTEVLADKVLTIGAALLVSAGAASVCSDRAELERWTARLAKERPISADMTIDAVAVDLATIAADVRAGRASAND